MALSAATAATRLCRVRLLAARGWPGRLVEGGEHTGALPGKVLRSGRDTHTYRPKSFDKVAAVA